MRAPEEADVTSDQDYERKWLQISHELDKLQISYRRLQSVNESLKRQIEALNKQQITYVAERKEAERNAHQAELRVELLGQNALIDQRVREGQIKRLRIVEHQMNEVLANSRNERNQRVKAEEKTANLTKALNRERAQRLHDLHLNFRVVGDSLSAMKRERLMEERCLSSERDAELVTRNCNLLETAVTTHHSVDSRSICTQAQQEHAIEWGRAKRLLLKSLVQEMRKDAQNTCFEKEYPQKELHRLPSNLITSTVIPGRAVKTNKRSPSLRNLLPPLP
jgi:hypothetical protein|tara:strand:- start:417 stop:1253 length:837 start_codon:yes stop_codon:yes gene_type:complete